MRLTGLEPTRRIDTSTSSWPVYQFQHSRKQIPPKKDCLIIIAIRIHNVNEFAEIGHTDSLYFYKHPDKAHFLIMIDPAVDRFILKCAKEEKVEMKQFDLSDELRSFTAQTKQVSSKEDTNFKKLFHEIKSAEMKALIDGQTSKL